MVAVVVMMAAGELAPLVAIVAALGLLEPQVLA